MIRSFHQILSFSIFLKLPHLKIQSTGVLLHCFHSPLHQRKKPFFCLFVFTCLMMTQQFGKASKRENALRIECLLHIPNFLVRSQQTHGCIIQLIWISCSLPLYANCVVFASLYWHSNSVICLLFGTAQNYWYFHIYCRKEHVILQLHIF